MPLARTPPRAQPFPANIMNPTKITSLTSTISNKINLMNLHSIVNEFLSTPNPQTEFPFQLPRDEVINIFSIDSQWAQKMASILKGTARYQTTITVHEMLTCITNSLSALTTDPSVTTNRKEGFEILLASIQTAANRTKLIKLATRSGEISLEIYLTTTKTLFEELREISSILKSQGFIWHTAYLTMNRMMDSYHHLSNEIEAKRTPPSYLKEVHSEFQEQFRNLEHIIEPYNDNVISMWDKVTKFQPNAGQITFRHIKSIKDGLSFYNNLSTTSMFAELSITQWPPPSNFQEVQEIRELIRRTEENPPEPYPVYSGPLELQFLDGPSEIQPLNLTQIAYLSPPTPVTSSTNLLTIPATTISRAASGSPPAMGIGYSTSSQRPIPALLSPTNTQTHQTTRPQAPQHEDAKFKHFKRRILDRIDARQQNGPNPPEADNPRHLTEATRGHKRKQPQHMPYISPPSKIQVTQRNPLQRQTFQLPKTHFQPPPAITATNDTTRPMAHVISNADTSSTVRHIPTAPIAFPGLSRTITRLLHNINYLEKETEDIKNTEIENRSEAYTAELISNLKDVNYRCKFIYEKNLPPHEEMQMYRLIERIRTTRKSLVLMKEETIRHRIQEVEYKRQLLKDNRELKLPTVQNALQYRHWMNAVATKNQSINTSAAKKSFATTLKSSVNIASISAAVHNSQAITEIVQLVQREVGSTAHLVTEAIQQIQNLNLIERQKAKKINIELQIKATTLGISIFEAFRGEVGEMSDQLIEALRSGILVYAWKQTLEEELASVLDTEAIANPSIRETINPGTIAKSYQRLAQPNLTEEAENHMEEITTEEKTTTNTLIEKRAKILHTLYFNFVKTRKSLQGIYTKVKDRNYIAYDTYASPLNQLSPTRWETDNGQPDNNLDEFEHLMEQFVECQPETAKLPHRKAGQISPSVLTAKAA